MRTKPIWLIGKIYKKCLYEAVTQHFYAPCIRILLSHHCHVTLEFLYSKHFKIVFSTKHTELYISIIIYEQDISKIYLLFVYILCYFLCMVSSSEQCYTGQYGIMGPTLNPLCEELLFISRG